MAAPVKPMQPENAESARTLAANVTATNCAAHFHCWTLGPKEHRPQLAWSVLQPLIVSRERQPCVSMPPITAKGKAPLRHKKS